MKRFKKIAAVAVAVIMILSTVFTLVACGPAVLDSIEISTPATKLVYTAGESFSTAGMVVTAKYSDGSSKTVTATVSATALKVGDTKVSVSYTEGGVTKSVDQAITVNAAAVTLVSIAIKTPATKVVYQAGEKFASAGMVVEATYSDGSKKEVTGWTVSLTDALKATDKEIVVTFDGKTAKLAITVNPLPSVIASVASEDQLVSFKLYDNLTAKLKFADVGSVKGVEREVKLTVVEATAKVAEYYTFEVKDQFDVNFKGKVTMFAGKSTNPIANIGDYRVTLIEDLANNTTPSYDKVVLAGIQAGYMYGSDATNKVELLANGQLRVIIAAGSFLGELIDGSYQFSKPNSVVVNSTYYKATIADGKINLVSYKKNEAGVAGNETEILKNKDWKALCTCTYHTAILPVATVKHFDKAQCNGYLCAERKAALVTGSITAVTECTCEGVQSGIVAYAADGETVIATFEFTYGNKLNVIVPGFDKVAGITHASAAKAATATSAEVLLGQFSFDIGATTYVGIFERNIAKDGGTIISFKKGNEVLIGNGSYPDIRPIELVEICDYICPTCGGWESNQTSCASCYAHPEYACFCKDVVAGVKVSQAAVRKNTYLKDNSYLVLEIRVLNDGTIEAKNADQSTWVAVTENATKTAYVATLGSLNYSFQFQFSGKYVSSVTKFSVDKSQTYRGVATGTAGKVLLENVALEAACDCTCKGLQLATPGAAAPTEVCGGHAVAGACGGYGCPTKVCDCEAAMLGGKVLDTDYMDPAEIDAFDPANTVAVIELLKNGKIKVIIDGNAVYASKKLTGENQGKYSVTISDIEYLLTLDTGASKFNLVVADPDDEVNADLEIAYKLACTCVNSCGVAGHRAGSACGGYACKSTKACDCAQAKLGFISNVAVTLRTKDATAPETGVFNIKIEILNNNAVKVTFQQLKPKANPADGYEVDSTKTPVVANGKLAADGSFLLEDVVLVDGQTDEAYKFNYKGTFNAEANAVTLTRMGKLISGSSATEKYEADAKVRLWNAENGKEAPAIMTAPCNCKACGQTTGGTHCQNMVLVSGSWVCSCKAYDHNCDATKKCDCSSIAKGMLFEDEGVVVEIRNDGKIVITIGNEAPVTIAAFTTAPCVDETPGHVHSAVCYKASMKSFKIGDTTYYLAYGIKLADNTAVPGALTLFSKDIGDPIAVVVQNAADAFINVCNECGTNGCSKWRYDDADDSVGHCICALWKCSCSFRSPVENKTPMNNGTGVYTYSAANAGTPAAGHEWTAKKYTIIVRQDFTIDFILQTADGTDQATAESALASADSIEVNGIRLNLNGSFSFYIGTVEYVGQFAVNAEGVIAGDVAPSGILTMTAQDKEKTDDAVEIFTPAVLSMPS